MTYGFQAINDGGVVQIDGNYSNYAMFASGTATTNPAGYLGTFVPLSISFTNNSGEYPIIFVQANPEFALSAAEYISFCINQTSPSSFQIVSSKANDAVMFPFSVVACRFNWRAYLPSYTRLAPTNQFGMNVFSPSGQLVFSSAEPGLMRVQALAEIGGMEDLYSYGGGPSQRPGSTVVTSLGPRRPDQALFPWVCMNQTQIRHIYYAYDADEGTYGTGSTMAAGFWVGGKTDQNNNRVINSYLDEVRFGNELFPTSGNTSHRPRQGLFSRNYLYQTYNPSTGILVADTGNSRYPSSADDLPVGSNFIYQLGYTGSTYIFCDPLTVQSVTKSSSTALSVFVGTGLSLPTSTVTGFLYANCKRKTDYGGQALQVPVFVTSAMVLDD